MRLLLVPCLLSVWVACQELGMLYLRLEGMRGEKCFVEELPANTVALGTITNGTADLIR